MNFIPKVRESSDLQWGGPVPNRSFFSGCIGEMQRGQFTMSGGPFAMSEVRGRVVDFPHPLLEDFTSILIQKPPVPNPTWNVFKPFAWPVWISMVAALFFSSGVSWFFSWVSPFSGWNMKLQFAIREEVSIKEHLWNVAGSLLQQGQEFYPTSFSSRAVLVFWWLFTVIIMASHSGDLTAFLTVQTAESEIKTLKEFISRGIPAHIESGFAIITKLEKSEDKTFKDMHKLVVEVASGTKCIESLLGSKQINKACLNDHTFIMNYARKFCKHVYEVPEYFAASSYGFLIPKDSIFHEVLSQHFRKIIEAGLFQKWFDKYYGGKKNCSADPSEANPISMAEAGGAFLVTIVFFGLGFLTLGVELIIHYLCTRKEKVTIVTNTM